MKLWIVIDNDRWGRSLNLVRAETREQAIDLISPKLHGRPHRPNPDRVHVEEISEGADPCVLWCEDESPDTPNERD